MKSWSIIMLFAILIACSEDDPEPIPPPPPSLEDQILGNWQFASASLIDDKGKFVTSNGRSEFCKQGTHPLFTLIRQIDVRILKDDANMAIIATECAENNGTYTLTFDTSNFTSLLRPDSVLTHNGVGIPMYSPNWKVKKVTSIELEMYRISPDEIEYYEVPGYKMIYSFRKK